ncbi:MAG: hypothetical protein ACYCX9_03385 [Candidatus Dormibacteria bacterium]|jgi:hypothetical protein
MPFSITFLIFLAVWLYAIFDTIRRRSVPFRERLLTALFLILLPPIGIVVWAVLLGHGLLRLGILLVFAIAVFGLLSRAALPGLLVVLLVILVAAGLHRIDSRGGRAARIRG